LNVGLGRSENGCFKLIILLRKVIFYFRYKNLDELTGEINMFWCVPSDAREKVKSSNASLVT